MSLISEENFKKKYLKYKSKYIALKTQIAGEAKYYMFNGLKYFDICSVNETLIMYKKVPIGISERLNYINWYGFFIGPDDNMIMFEISDSNKLKYFKDNKFKENVKITRSGIFANDNKIEETTEVTQFHNFYKNEKITSSFTNRNIDDYVELSKLINEISNVELEIKKIQNKKKSFSILSTFSTELSTLSTELSTLSTKLLEKRKFMNDYILYGSGGKGPIYNFTETYNGLNKKLSINKWKYNI